MDELPLQLPEVGWEQELRRMEDVDIPRDLARLLIALVLSFQRQLVPPTASDRLMQMASDFLKKGIALGGKWYDIGVYVPDDGGKRRRVFVLLPKYPGGNIRRIEEFNLPCLVARAVLFPSETVTEHIREEG